jgi:hypothetical protein
MATPISTQSHPKYGSDRGGRGDTGETGTLVMRSVGEEREDFASVEFSCSTDADLELSGRPLGDRDIPTVFREDDGIRF